MEDKKVLSYIENVLENMPVDWLNLTTHRLDIYEEKLAKSQFLEGIETLFKSGDTSPSALKELPTAFDYIRLGHPLSCLLEWAIARIHQLDAGSVVSFSSATAPVLAILRKNLLDRKKTRIVTANEWLNDTELEKLQRVYGYEFELLTSENIESLPPFEGGTVWISRKTEIADFNLQSGVDFVVNVHSSLGSIIVVNNKINGENDGYVSEIQHVRRRETIAMTPANTWVALRSLIGQSSDYEINNPQANRARVLETIKEITGADTTALVASSGLSIQYGIMMGLIDHALETHPGKDIKILVPPNCYGGTNDQARRVAACIENVEVVDLPVDGENDMVQSVDRVLAQIASIDAVPYIIAEIPTNPRVEVPNLNDLREALSTSRKTATGATAIAPVFILDQTFCPNVHFLGEGDILSTVKTISYVSGSKFPSGGRCTAGYCVANKKAESLMGKIAFHLKLCDNEATDLQMEILAKQLPSMNQRIHDAYKNTREFVNFINDTLPEAKINFVSTELAAQGFTPSVFSLDLPTKGSTDEEREAYKRKLNHQLINSMITKIPDESKYCVSYGQLKGCYWTIPATSTQGTTKEGDKDYIARVALSPDMDVERHKEVFADFVSTL